jgi:signal peptidase I
MNRSSRVAAGSQAEPASGQRAAESAGPPKRKPKNGRESIESFVVVFVSFLLWSLEAEGFVIPTGSMAPTLMGRHKEIVCPQCDHVYRVNADREVDSGPRGSATERRIERGTCENCRFEAELGDAPSFSGDRIYVMKNGVALPWPKAAGKVALARWDVAVFKLPEEPEVRYIKRLVGMPNEILRIDGGDLWARPAQQSAAFERLRRPLGHQQAMQMMVNDDAHRPRALRDLPGWLRWTATPSGAWTEPVAGQFVAGKQAGDWTELRYHHLVPSPEEWRAIRDGVPLASPPKATLITDFNSYNTDLLGDELDQPRRAARAWFQPHWVGDLTLSLRLEVRAAAGRFRVELIRAGLSNRCEIDLATGAAQLFHGDTALGPPVRTAVARPGSYELCFANVDERLTLWIDGAVPFGAGLTYEVEGPPAAPAAADLEPARIGTRNADIRVDKLVLKRDVYYTLEPTETDYSNLGSAEQLDPRAFFELLADPSRFAALSRRLPREYPIAPGRYLMLGDNSPWSRDARAWGRADQINPDLPGAGWDDSDRASWEVPEALLVGKAFCVYWPHAKPVWPGIRLSADVRIPILPYVERMRWIR